MTKRRHGAAVQEKPPAHQMVRGAYGDGGLTMTTKTLPEVPAGMERIYRRPAPIRHAPANRLGTGQIKIYKS
jgi:hypothetical protein